MFVSMQQLKNKLNNLKAPSEKASKSQSHDCTPESAFEIIQLISQDCSSFSGKKVLVGNSQTGILPVGIKLLGSSLTITIVEEDFNEIMKGNLQGFNMECDVVQTGTELFKSKAFDIGIIGPILEKGGATDLKLIGNIIDSCKGLYAVFRNEHRKVLLDKYRNSKELGSTMIKPPGSSKFSKQNFQEEQFNIYKIER